MQASGCFLNELCRTDNLSFLVNSFVRHKVSMADYAKQGALETKVEVEKIRTQTNETKLITILPRGMSAVAATSK